MRISGSCLGRLKRNKLSNIYGTITQKRPGDWAVLGDINWNHLKHTRDDLHMLIDMERVEFRTRQAMNAESYFQKLVFIALNKEKQPKYANEQLSWWLGTGGIPENYLHHKKHEEQPLERDTGIESKFHNIILPRLTKMRAIKKPTTRAWLGNFDKRETLYWGDDYAAGLTYDPQSFKAIIETDVTSYSVLEIKGNPFPALPIPRPDPRTLVNQLLSVARGENTYLLDGERRNYSKGEIKVSFL